MRRRTTLLAALALMALTGALVMVALWRLPGEQVSVGSPSARAEADVRPGEVPWVFSSQVPPDGGPLRFVVQAGVVGEDQARVDVEVPWAVDAAIDISRTPAVSRPAAGAVFYVADDGTSSTVYRLAIERGAIPEALAEVGGAAWSIAVTPDGSAAYVALATRGRPDDDLGVVRVALDGSGQVEQLLPPVAVRPDEGARLAAVAAFTTSLDLSSDGRYLARTTCRGVAGCTTSLIELSSREILELRDISVVDLGASGMMIAARCHQIGCTTALVDLETGAMQDLPDTTSDATVVDMNGRPVVVAIDAGVRSSVVLVDPQTGVSHDLYTAPEQSWMNLGSRMYSLGTIDGAVLVVESGEAGALVQQRLIVVPLDGSALTEVPMPPVFQMGPPAAKG